jgi:hypothetical protein
MSHLLLGIVAAVTVAASGATSQLVETPSPQGPNIAHQQALVREAEAFMAEYARLLLAGDRAGIAALYDPDSAVLVWAGDRSISSLTEIVARYRDRWRPPQSFEWVDLHYEPVGPDAVVVLGRFAWSAGGRAPDILSYHALLRRHRGRLVIRIEDEALIPPAA